MLSAAAMGGGWTNLAMVEMSVWFETWPEVKTSAAALHTDDKARYRLVLCLRDPHADDLHRAAAPLPRSITCHSANRMLQRVLEREASTTRSTENDLQQGKECNCPTDS
jgi:hypothetical protein